MAFTIVFFVIIVVVVCAIVLPQKKKLLDSGAMIKRNDAFWKKAELFFTNSSFEQFVEALRRSQSILSENGISTEYHMNDGVVLFQGSTWKSYVEYIGAEEDKNQFKFAFASWQTYRGMPQNVMPMNVALTTVEKAFLSLDPQTSIETHDLKLKTR